MIGNYIEWCLLHGMFGYLLLIATALGVIFLGAAIWSILFWRD